MMPRPDRKDIDREARLGTAPVTSRIQAPDERVRNFDEVYLPWTEDMAVQEASRCLHCDDRPCVKACPLGNDIPLALWLTEQGDFTDAARVLRRTNNAAELCGRLCSPGNQCGAACPHPKEGQHPVAVNRVEAFLADRYRKIVGWETDRPPSTGEHVAVVGAGPAGLTVAELLRQNGHSPTVFARWAGGGGSLRYATPRFQLDHGLVRKRLDWLKEMGVEFVYDTRVGEGVGVDHLLADGFRAVFLGTGAGEPEEAGLAGRNLQGVHEAVPFLVRSNVEQNLRPSDMEDPPRPGERVAVIGGGATALSCARTARRLGSREVTCFFPGVREEEGPDPRELGLAREEGVRIRWEVTPRRLKGEEDGSLREVECVDGSGREFPVPVDTAILSFGYRPDPELPESVPGLKTEEGGHLAVDSATGRTSRERVWAGGGNVSGRTPLGRTLSQARMAARDMHLHLRGG